MVPALVVWSSGILLAAIVFVLEQLRKHQEKARGRHEKDTEGWLAAYWPQRPFVKGSPESGPDKGRRRRKRKGGVNEQTDLKRTPPILPADFY